MSCISDKTDKKLEIRDTQRRDSHSESTENRKHVSKQIKKERRVAHKLKIIEQRTGKDVETNRACEGRSLSERRKERVLLTHKMKVS